MYFIHISCIYNIEIMKVYQPTVVNSARGITKRAAEHIYIYTSYTYHIDII